MSEKKENSEWDTSHSLLDRIKNPADKKSWTDFIRFYEDFIYCFLRRMNISESDAEELQQMISIKLWEVMPEGKYDRTKGKFRSWLATIIRRDAINFIRNKKKREQLTEENLGYIANQITNEDHDSSLNDLIEKEWQEYLTQCAWNSVKIRFQKNVQQVFLLTMQGKSTDEIAKECDIAAKTVTIYCKRIREHLDTEIGKINMKFS